MKALIVRISGLFNPLQCAVTDRHVVTNHNLTVEQIQGRWLFQMAFLIRPTGFHMVSGVQLTSVIIYPIFQESESVPDTTIQRPTGRYSYTRLQIPLECSCSGSHGALLLHEVNTDMIGRRIQTPGRLFCTLGTFISAFFVTQLALLILYSIPPKILTMWRPTH